MAISPDSNQKSIDLQRYFLDLFQCSGAVTEVAGFSLVEALLPEDIAAVLEVPAHVLLAFDYEVAMENPEAEFVTFGSPLLDKAILLGKNLGKAAKKYAAPEHLTVPPNMLEKVEKRVDFVRCRKPSLLSASLLRCEYIRFDFTVRFLSDEKQEAIYPVLVDTLAAREVSYQMDWLKSIFFAAEVEPLGQIPPGSHCGYGKAYQIAKDGLSQAVEKDLADFRQRMAGYLQGEEKRLQAYYVGTKAEISRRMSRLDAGDPRRQKLEQKMAATEADYQKRLKDVRNKFQVAVEAELDSLVVYVLPKVKLQVQVQHKTQTAVVEFFYNLAAGQLELPYCPKCQQPFSVVHIAKDGAIRCPGCAGQA